MNDISLKASSKENVSRQYWADLCRVTAIFGVILIHASGPFFYKFGKISQINWLSANFLDSLVRCSVPLFVMLSGALLLKRGATQITILQIFQRAAKVALPLLVWNVGYLFYVSHFTGAPVKLLSMLTQPPMYHLWFVYMIVGIYVLLPILQVIFELICQRKDLQIYLFILWVIVTCVPVYKPIPLLTILQQTSLFGYGGYFLIGGVIAASRQNKISTALWLSVYAFGVAVTFLLTFYFSQQAQTAVETAYVYFSPNVLISSVAAFVLFSRVKVTEKFGLIMKWISDRSFLIFFMHVLVLEHVNSIILSTFPGLPAYLFVVIAALATFFVSLAIAAVLRLLPASRAVLG